MKIQKFNESINKSYTKEDFNKLEKMKNEVETFEKDIKIFLTEYLLLNPEIQHSKTKLFEDETCVTSFEYHEKLAEPLEFSYRPEADDDEYWWGSLNKKHFEDFLEYIKNSEIYKTGRKYNL